MLISNKINLNNLYVFCKPGRSAKNFQSSFTTVYITQSLNIVSGKVCNGLIIDSASLEQFIENSKQLYSETQLALVDITELVQKFTNNTSPTVSDAIDYLKSITNLPTSLPYILIRE